MEKIQELTDKIYREGIEKAQADASGILSAAEKDAANIISDANKEAEKIKKEASEAARKLEEKTTAEIKLYARQAFSSIRSAIMDMLSNRIVEIAMSDLKLDKKFINKLLIEVAGKWAAGESLVVGSSQAAALHKYVATYAKELLDGGLMFRKEENEQPLFSITSLKSDYKVNFGDAEFESYLRSIIRPQLAEMLFND